MTHDWIDVASSVGLLTLSCLGAVFGYLYRRDSNRNDEEITDNKRTLTALGEKIDSHARQIRDTRAAVASCETALKIEHYPYTD